MVNLPSWNTRLSMTQYAQDISGDPPSDGTYLLLIDMPPQCSSPSHERPRQNCRPFKILFVRVNFTNIAWGLGKYQSSPWHLETDHLSPYSQTASNARYISPLSKEKIEEQKKAWPLTQQIPQTQWPPTTSKTHKPSNGINKTHKYHQQNPQNH